MTPPKDNRGILLEVGTNEVEFLRFCLGVQMFGINVSKIRQVMVFQESTVVEIPGTPPSILGTYCFRGTPIAIVDLDVYFNRAIPVLSSPRLLLVSEFNETTVGFIVDSVDRIMRCSWKEFAPLEQNQFGTTDSTIVGTVIRDNEMIPILDVEAILANIMPSVSIEAHVGEPLPEARNGVDRASASIVYCEDSSIVQKVLIKTLNTAGFKNIKLFSNGADGLEHIKQQKVGSIDLIISDIEMPKMDGLTLCREVRKVSEFQKVPFIFFSSTVNEEMRRKCEQVGGNAAFSKPEVQMIIEAMDKHLIGA